MNYLRSHRTFQRISSGVKFYRNRLIAFGAFSAAYGCVLYKHKNHPNEIYRMALAGSLSNMIWEVGFHFADTVNIRSKLHAQNVTTFHMLSHIYREEGIYGLSKGISACFYGSIVWGFMYFSLYKMLKSFLHRELDQKVHSSVIYLLASFIAESITILVYYPYDLIKSRLQTSNRRYGYRSLIHAFQKEITENGIRSLYKGSSPFLLMYSTMISVQFMVYESYIKFIKDRSVDNFYKNELLHIVTASFLSGAIGSALTNGLEVVVVTKQTEPEKRVMNIVKEQKFNLLTKGLGARVYYQSIQSIVFFSTVTYVSRLFNVELED